MTLDVALTIASKRDVELWPMCVAGSAGWSPDSLRETALDILTEEVLRLQAELATAEAELQEHRRIAGELDVLLGSGCNAAQPELVEQLQQHLAIAEAAVGPSALDTLAREVRRLQGEVELQRGQLSMEERAHVTILERAEAAEAALATAEVHAKGHSLNVLSLMKFNDQLKEEIAALREQVAEREDAAFMAGWNAGKACHTGIATLTEARAAWQARQKGTPT